VIHSEDIGVEASETTNDPFPDLNPSKSIPILVRATDGKSKESRAEKIKLSTIVEPDALDGFFIKYAEVCKLGMSGLKKRNRSKAKEKLKAKKKKLGGVAATGDVKKA
jgi:signal recognition particle subunit SRP14